MTVDKCRQSTKGLVKIEGEDRTLNCPGSVRLKHVLNMGSVSKMGLFHTHVLAWLDSVVLVASAQGCRDPIKQGYRF